MQHEETRTAMSFAGLTAYETWMHYCNMGGCTDYFEFDAYLYGVLALEMDDADLVSQAVNELIDDTCPDVAPHCRAPYSWRPSPRAACFDLDDLDGDGEDIEDLSTALPLGTLAQPPALHTFASRLLTGLDVRSLGLPGIPLPPGSHAELLGDILGSGADGVNGGRGVLGRIVPSDTP